ncbi:MAG: 30S ribosome-binding factor RbfA [Oscillospiraceae bacterium]|nr:30S ribosome-binding factor RbfA [Oscillospiraceae bacterium]
MPSDNRMLKIGEEILRELSCLVSALKDPRVKGLVSLTRAEVTRDLEYAKVYVSVLDGTADAKAVMDGLKSASGFLRRELAHNLMLRATPKLQFISDDSIAHGARIQQLLSQINNEGPPS